MSFFFQVAMIQSKLSIPGAVGCLAGRRYAGRVSQVFPTAGSLFCFFFVFVVDVYLGHLTDRIDD